VLSRLVVKEKFIKNRYIYFPNVCKLVNMLLLKINQICQNL
jgi:hypothetical protein